MKKTNVVISYDLERRDGVHAEFKKQMQVLGWSFEYSGQPLPNTTCWGKLTSGSSCEAGKKVAEDHIIKAMAEVKRKYPLAKMERYYVVAFEAPPAVVSFKSL